MRVPSSAGAGKEEELTDPLALRLFPAQFPTFFPDWF